MKVLDLVEHRWTRFGRDYLDEVQVARALAQSRRPVKVDWPNPTNDFTWGLQPDGWIGTLRVSETLGLRVVPKTGLERLSTWLAWTAYAVESRLLEAPRMNSEDTLSDLVVDAIFRLLEERFRRGIHRDYVRRTSSGTSVKGRPLLRESLLRLACGNVDLVYEQSMLTADIEDNRLVYWALHRLSMLHLLNADRTHRLHWLLGFMASTVRLSPAATSEFQGRRYSARALDYAAIHRLCALLLEGMGPDAAIGESDFGEFTLAMWDLFQTAVVTALRRGLEPQADVDATFSLRLGGGFVFRPDVVVRFHDSSGPIVVEVKYKDPTDGIAPHDVRQAVAYATALGARRALLVYPESSVPKGVLTAGTVTVEFAHLDLSETPDVAMGKLVERLTALHHIGFNEP